MKAARRKLGTAAHILENAAAGRTFVKYKPSEVMEVFIMLLRHAAFVIIFASVAGGAVSSATAFAHDQAHHASCAAAVANLSKHQHLKGASGMAQARHRHDLLKQCDTRPG